MSVQRGFRQAATVETYAGHVNGVDTFAAPVTRKGFLDDEAKAILSTSAQQTVAASTWYTAITDVDLYVLKSKITVNGRTSQVLEVKRRAFGVPGRDHLEVSLS